MMIYYPAKLVIKNYIPSSIEEGMFFSTVYHPNTDNEIIDVWELVDLDMPLNEVISKYGYPVNFHIIDEDEFIELVKPEQIGWIDEEDQDSLIPFNLSYANKILNQGGDIEIVVNENKENIFIDLVEEKVVISIPLYIEEDNDETIF